MFTRHANCSDLIEIVKIHVQSFQGFLTKPGKKFLHSYYNLVLNFGGSKFLVCEDTKNIVGFVVGFKNHKILQLPDTVYNFIIPKYFR